ncbi:MAG: UvrD-helicase domain-containing protein [Gemmatimonadales bacterium]
MSDAAARARIRDDLDTNLLVEAGAGSGKTTCLVERMVNLIRQGEPVERIAAVTFTRKAANELRERFQVGLELARHAAVEEREQRRIDVALRDLDNSFVGTIHAFCGRLLRERALEAGLDPTFEEVDQEALEQLRNEFFGRWLERSRLNNAPALAQLEQLGIEPQDLATAFGRIVDNPDVQFPLTDVARPDHAQCRQALGRLLAEADPLMPTTEPASGWDPLMKLVRGLRYRGRVGDWNDLAQFCAVIGGIKESHCEVTLNRWSDEKNGKLAAKTLSGKFVEFTTGIAADLLGEWREHRYPVVMTFLREAAESFTRERRRTGRLGFQDLLMQAADLLRTNPLAREALGERFRRLLVDEFQDTDPIQAEVCLLLTSDVAEGNDWREVTPRTGALFVVGDPKQSIYRFRRADLETYNFVRERLQSFGAVLKLTRNFRSTKPIEDFVNAYAGDAFAEDESKYQAPFAPMQTDSPVLPGDAVFRYPVRAGKNDDILADDAAKIASWIATQIASVKRKAGDFLILVYRKHAITAFAEALAARNVAVVTTGAKLPQERELTELRLLLEALADPGNPVLVAAVLEGLFFGLSPADLYAAKDAGIRFTALHPPSGTGPVTDALAQLHGWCGDAARDPADLLLERIIDETGLLPYAASQSLGDGRAGTLLHLIGTIREAASAGQSGLTEAIAAIDRALQLDGSATLRPGRGDAVRVMNLHQAKGLEAPVVILAAPLEDKVFEPEIHVSRTTDGAEGGIAVFGVDGELLAHPPGWDIMQAEEANFLAAERDRLRYVAATRPQHQLLVAQLMKDGVVEDESPWAPFGSALEQHATRLDLAVTPASGRQRLERPVAELVAEVEVANARVQRARHETFRQNSVTRLARDVRIERQEYDLPRAAVPAGRAWGTAVHRAVEAMGRGRSGESLRRFVVAVLREELPNESASQLQERAVRLEALLQQVAVMPEWQGRVGIELGVMRVEQQEGVELISEGVVDLLTRSDGHDQVVDWKTDATGWDDRRAKYEAQVAEYTEMLRGLGYEMGAGRIERLS